MHRTIWLSAALIAAGAAAQAESLSFDAALKLAEQQSPDLAAQEASIEAARSSSQAAGALPDPKLTVGVENLPINRGEQWSLDRDFMTMRKVGVMQDIPNSALRRAQKETAAAAIERSNAEHRVALLTVRREIALAWLNRYYLEQREALFDELDRENQLFSDGVQAQLAGGKGLPADVVVPKQEAAELADRLDELHALVAKAKATLRRYVGAVGDEPLANDAPILALDVERLRTHVHEHPELAVFAPMLAMARAAVHEAEAAKKPDWGVELAYAKRGPEFSDMVSMQLTIGLPLFAAHRQDPQIDVKRHVVAQVNAERDAMLRDHTRELEADLADYDTLTSQSTRMREVRVPLAQQKVDYQFASYRADKGDLNAVLSARRELIEVRLKQLELQSAQAMLAAKLYFSYGEGVQ